jgi:hypothetical protein
MHPTRTIVTPSIALVALLALCACAGDRHRDEPREPVAPVSEPAPVPAPRPAQVAREETKPAPSSTPRPWEGGTSVASNAGTYRVVYKTAPDAIPRGTTFAIDAWVFAADAPDRPLADVRLAADAAMPEHGHGMNRKPTVERAADGRFRIEGMLFHMPGLWQLYLDVTSGALTERAQVDVDLE